ncbi:MAG: DUF6491 family protein [Hyphomonadaceae bacterium]
MRIIMMLAALSTLCATAAAEPADPQARPAPAFNVIEGDARLAFADHRISGFSVARDNSLILRAGAGRWYRATLWQPCGRELRWAFDRIALDTGPSGTLDRFSTVIVNRMRCPIESIDRIERPEPGYGY